MTQPRRDEKNKPAANHGQRQSRGYQVNGQWYFELRGGGQKGPFSSEQEMQAELNQFIQFHEEMNQQS